MMMRMMMRRTYTTLSSLIHKHASNHPNKLAISDGIVSGSSSLYTYKQLYNDANALKHVIKSTLKPINNKTIASLCPSSYSYVVSMLAVWELGYIFVPLPVSSPLTDLKHYIQNETSLCIVSSSCQYSHELTSYLQHEDIPYIAPLPSSSSSTALAKHDDLSLLNMNALIIYTSGTTGKPKGVVHTHDSIMNQIISLQKAWLWTQDDYILNVLPLHHVHGLINVLCCSLASGATCEFHQNKSSETILNRLVRQHHHHQITLFMAVPTIYSKLLKYIDETNQTSKYVSLFNKCKNSLRLMVSGSSSLPIPIFNKWKKYTGYTLLERYGMSEFGMALSNPIHPISNRIPGHVGHELPGIETMIISSNDDDDNDDYSIGELYIHSKQLFREYWYRVDATNEAFIYKDNKKWFCTGDIVERNNINNVYRILGRKSVDIIKSGGYKLSALEIETHILSYQYVEECIVVGVKDDDDGEAEIKDIAEIFSKNYKE